MDFSSSLGSWLFAYADNHLLFPAKAGFFCAFRWSLV
jgi:hypothetical protein